MSASTTTMLEPDATQVSGVPSFVKIFVGDLDAAAAFYAHAFGFTQADRLSTRLYDEIILAPHAGGVPRLILCRWNDGRALVPGNSRGPIGLGVRDVPTAYRHAIAQGASPVLQPTSFKSLDIAIVRDPDGHELELVAKARDPG